MVSSSGSLAYGFLGGNRTTAVVGWANNHWDTDTSGIVAAHNGVAGSDAGKVDGHITTDMRMQATFDPPWDFTTIWSINEGVDYPVLQ